MKPLKLNIFTVTLLLSLLFLTLLPISQSIAGPLPTLYVEANYAETKIRLTSGKYKISASGFKLGYYFSPKISVEAQYMQGLGDDSINSTVVEIDNISSLYVRFGTDARKNFRSYILLGQSNVSLSSSSLTESTYEDFSWAIGAEERLRRWPLFILNAEYVRHYDHNGFTINSTSLGLRYEF